LELGVEHLEKLRVARHFKVNVPQDDYSSYDSVLNSYSVNSLDFYADGTNLIAAHNNDTLRLYDCINGRSVQEINSKKYGVSIVKCTHAKDVILHTSTKVDDSLRYLTLHENKYIRYFRGHEKKVTNLTISPINDTIISASLDNTVRMWDLNSQNCQGIINMTSPAIVDIDPQGLIFAVGLNNIQVNLYDLKTYDKGPFSSFNVNQNTNDTSEWRAMKFTPDGSKIAIITTKNLILFIDSFSGSFLYSFTDFENLKGNCDVTFTPNSKYGLCGSSNGKIVVFNTENGETVLKKDTQHANPSIIAFNPYYALLATADSHIDFWLPHIGSSKDLDDTGE